MTRSGLYANALYTENTLVGHGSVLSQRKFDNTIMLNSASSTSSSFPLTQGLRA